MLAHSSKAILGSKIAIVQFMNLILLFPEEKDRPLAPSDPRTLHLRDILKAGQGRIVNAGILGEGQGQARVNWLTEGFVTMEFLHLDPPPRPLPLTLIIGTPRPPTARRLLRDLSSLGLERLIWTSSALGEKSYLQSTLWRDGEYRWECLLGAMQGEIARLPQTVLEPRFHRVFELDLPSARFYLDPTGKDFPESLLEKAVIAVGPERGWTAEETALLRRRGFIPLGLGPRTLRTETACIAASALAQRLWFHRPFRPGSLG